MLTTKNYKLKKPELTDSPPDITVTNPNWDLVDEKLFAVIQAWEEFKKNGGTIGGDINIGSPTKSTVTSFISERLCNGTVYKTRVATGVEGTAELQVLDENNNTISRLGLGRKELVINGEGNSPIDIMIGGVSKNTNGYTKLPNGMIMQWGNINIPVSGNNNGVIKVTFPIRFNTDVISYSAICNGNSFSWGNSDLCIGVGGTSPSDMYLTCSTRNGNNVNGTVGVKWIAIGY